MNFTCKKCESKEVEEVVLGVVQYTNIRGITEDGHLDYGETSYEGGGEDGDTRYQCKECGETITDEHGRALHLIDIVKFLTKEKGGITV